MADKIVVTGGSGFIGTNLIEYLIDKGYKVINYDIAEPKNKNRIELWKKVDLRDCNRLKEELLKDNPLYIIDLAARTDLNGKSIEDYDSNTVAVKNILECARALEDLKKIIITSSMLVCKVGYQPKDQFDYAPSTVYGESKVITEKTTWEAKLECDWAIIRPTSIWGPWFDVPYRNFFDMVIKHRYFHIGNKSCTKTYGYIGNAVYQIEKIMLANTEDTSKKIYYLGDYEPYPIEIWANEISEQLGYKIIKLPFCIIKCAAWFGDILKAFGISFPMTSFRLKNMTTDNVVNMENTKEIVGECLYSRKEGISETLRWIQSN